MALGNVTELGANDVYAQMLKDRKFGKNLSERKLILEGSDNDLIHAEIEEILNEFKSKISVEGTEEKIRDVEKYPTLTAAEKSIIKSIQKVLDALADLEKVEYSGIITMVGKQKSSDSETELEQKDKEFAENQDKEKSGEAPADESFNFDEAA